LEIITLLGTFPVSLGIAFGLGFGARLLGLPAMVGFLVAGFILSALGVQASETIKELADFGVLLLLFTIGLKLKIKTLAQPEVCVGASVHALLMVAIFGALFYGLSIAGISAFADLTLETAALVAFALSFSSTVFAVKILESKGELGSLHGRTAIGILIMQDVFAVLFLTLSTGKVPSPWAFALLGLFFIRPMLGYILDRVGHGELLPLLGLFSAVALGATTFKLVGLKPDLGALIVGMLMADHKRAGEIADSLFSFKEIFLVAFFLNIGLAGLPNLEDIGVALFLVLLLPVKVALYFYLDTRFKLRARSGLLASLSLANYSEFGLIVAGIGVTNGWIGTEWLIIIAIALSISFVIASPLNTSSQNLYVRFHDFLLRFQTKERHPLDQPLDPGTARIAIFGMGQVGVGAYDYIREHHGDVVIGIDSDAEKVARHIAEGRNVIHGDATDSDFWERTRSEKEQIEVIMLAMPEHASNMYALEQITHSKYQGYIAALAEYSDEAESLIEGGAHTAFHVHTEAGTGFAAHVEEQLLSTMPRQPAGGGA
jgi:predicted Kef-type K+ transport protein